MEFLKHTLDNGLEIVAECNPKAYSMALAFFVEAGARDETDELSGVSHFLEHMAFKGTPRRTAEDVNRELDELGSHSNAYTSEEQTVYYITVLPEYQDRAVELMSDIMRPVLREEDFQTEKQVILEEIAKYDDQPPFGAHEKSMAAHFGSHPLARSVLGTMESVRRMTAEQMRGYFRQRYSPGNMVLVAAGNVDFPRLVATAEKHCGSWQPQPAGRELRLPEPGLGFEVFPKEIATQQYVVQLADGPSGNDEQRHASRLLATVLGDDSGSRLFWELVDTGRAEFASMGAYEFQDTGVLMTFLCCSPEDTADNLQQILEIVRQAQRDGITEAELNQAKNKICSHVVLRSERPSNRLFAVGGSWTQRRQYRTVREVVEAYQRVTVTDLARMLEKHPLSRNTTVAVGPLSQLNPPVAGSG